jgi:hypothetical protein
MKYIKFKGKTKAEMIEALNKNEVAENATDEGDEGFTEKSVKELRELCCKAGLSRLETKMNSSEGWRCIRIILKGEAQFDGMIEEGKLEHDHQKR